MLSSFTWQQYLLTAGALLGLYYLAVLLLYCREEVIQMLKGKTSRASLPADQPIPPQVSIMGPASPEAGPLLSAAEAIRVAPLLSTETEEPEDAVVHALLQEIKPLLELANEADAEKEELLPLLRLVIARHSPSIQHHHREAVAAYLTALGKRSFLLTPEDLRSLWTETPTAQ
ncbi:hypothetical protein CLV24_14021 [Pontibacter ummariensis]|uniref:Uncharacterized protein n=1 Tax=Pontibacter ummariensis TaxID=1610492 RepID=A0A239LG36_9BACT|nr:hypothetical protein [Pontibacter ummariensis]PRY03645.1 hypothetical protein CLV24_14021 [Pontibacter ummariensis]SNT28902.1 hypothetical protein SAMN06296052_14021 [Pontibacter ummariensis]